MISFDPTDRAPIFEQLCRSVCRDIASGLLREGDRLPSARELAKQLQLNPYSKLEADGIIYSLQGKGCFVAKHEGKASERFTEAFRAAVREALAAGASEEELIAMIREMSPEKNKESKE